MHLLIGGDGLVGSAIRHELSDRHLAWQATSRKAMPTSAWPDPVLLDLAAIDWRYLPMITRGTVYLVAYMSKFIECESSPLAWRVNVDAQIELARQYARHGAFVVFISSEAVEKAGGTAYGRQKAHVESYMRTIDAAIIRPSRIVADRVHEFAKTVVDIGMERKPGLVRWSAANQKVIPWPSEKNLDHALAVQA